MQEYTAATKPPRDWYIEEDIDWEALRSVYTLVCRFAAEAKLNPRPAMPAGIIGRDADNIRGMLALADACGSEISRRAREAFATLLEQQKAEAPEIVILRHAIEICDMLELERIKGTELDKELRRLDSPGANWSRYRGPGGDENEHPITAPERAELLRQSGIESKPMRPVGGGNLFRGYERSWFVEALREHEPVAPDDDAGPGRGRLRLITPALGFGLATSPILVTAFGQVPNSVVGAGLPGLVLACTALLALARRRRQQASCSPSPQPGWGVRAVTPSPCPDPPAWNAQRRPSGGRLCAECARACPAYPQALPALLSPLKAP
jgi:hypothetical protein